MSALRKPLLLTCDDDPRFRKAIQIALRNKFQILEASDPDEAEFMLRRQNIDIVLLDVSIGETKNCAKNRDGLEAIPRIRALNPEVSIVMASGLSDFSTVTHALRQGADDYLRKGFSKDELHHSLERVLQKRRTAKRKIQSDRELLELQKRYEIIGFSNVVKELKALVERVRNSNTNVLITGETGTGKELVARLLRRRHKDGGLTPFVTIDSATILSTMAEAILFGNEKGAFTGALSARKGIFEEAHEGTVYFDEIGNMPLEIQAKLLRVLQEKEVCRLGSHRRIHLDFRVVAATNRNLSELVESGTFLPDLFQRLNVVPIHVPPLRERLQDLNELVNFFAKQHQRPHLQFSKAALKYLQQYQWPGNIRELSNLIACLIATKDHLLIDAKDLPERLKKNSKPEMPSSFYEKVSAYERCLLGEAYENQPNISQLAVQLGMDRSHLYTKLKTFGLHSSTRKISQLENRR